MYGESHETQAHDIVFYQSAAKVLQYDHSQGYWWFGGKDIVNVGSLKMGAPVSFAQLALKSGGINTVGYSLENAANSNRIFEVRTDASNSAVVGIKNNAAVEKITLDGGSGNVSIGGTLNAANLPEYANDNDAGIGGLTTGDIYRTPTGEVRWKLAS